MKKLTLILLLSIVANLTAQKDNTWHAYFAEDGFTRGFKNKQGEVMISPKFKGYTVAKKFRNIIAVTEKKDNKYISYYLLKNKKKIGKDSVSIWNMAFDCESEGMIRFRDKKTDKVGFFDSQGKVTIPARYSDANPFRNNVAVVINNAQRKCLDNTVYQKEKPCEHWKWDGGEVLLIDKKNNILIKDFKYNTLIDLYSMKENDTTTLSYRLTQVGSNNNYYSFNNYEKQFEHWFFNDFIKSLEVAKKFTRIQLLERKLLENTMPKIYSNYTETIPDAYKIEATQFVKSYSKYLTKTFISLQKGDANYFINVYRLNSEIWKEPLYEKYFNDCGGSFIAKYPVFSIVINKGSGEDNYQEVFKFLKTDEGFKLISAGTSNENKIKLLKDLKIH